MSKLKKTVSTVLHSLSGGSEEKKTQPIVWSERNRCSVGDVNFFATVDNSEYHAMTSNDNEFLLVKTREMIEAELECTSKIDVRNIVDIGVWQGGSVALLDSVFRPDKLVAIEYSTRELPHLDAYIDKHSRQKNVRLYKGVSQADIDRFGELLDAEFGNKKIDLVIDDASHQYLETKLSFNLVFPRMSEGGIFVIEDWQWSTMEEHYNSDYFEGKEGLANLVLQCVMACACRPDIVREVIVKNHSVMVVRGDAELQSGTFDITEIARNKGEAIPLIL
ncbi:class I SAM-dependent methyltransferase [uncultured Ruegeria sp.]|uniref:class I SAM-dependent methyltransferase n=1 Tax=uncultured Ruegeria sp. TaxID=259304 RepID=UPI002609D88F|nr:class I SAM-dependent methyltransferase [uncultured Ruegeria sp.]